MFDLEKKQEKKQENFYRKISLVILILVFILIAFFAGMYVSTTSEVFNDMAKKETIFFGKLIGKYSEDDRGRLSQDIDFNLYWDLWDTLKGRYVDEVDINEQKMFYGSLKGLASSLGDPYTVFLDPSDSQEFQEILSGTFEGIGAEVGMRDEVLTIIAPLSGMPAQKAGLMPGDKVFEIDGESTMNLSIDEAVGKIRGEKGTKVVLTIYREGMDETIEIEIERGIIHVESVTTEIKDDIYIIKLTNFNSDTLSLFNKAVREISVKNSKGIILDLRNNPGGYLETSIEITSEWVEEGAVLIEKFGNGEEVGYQSRGIARLKDYPTVVLVNMGSASASEIVAGALKDYDKATIVGEKTFGKGSVQALESFKDGSTAKITVAKWLTPNGNSINDEGITPDEEVEYTIDDFKEGRDPQMDRAIEILSTMNDE